jgi:hypothetical protein
VNNADARAAKERKQKIFVAVGGVVLLLLVAIQLPGYLGGGSSATEASSTTTETPGVEAPVAAAPNTPVAAVTPEPAKLRSFSAFTRKNPFVQQVKSDPPATAPAPVGSKGGSGGKQEKPKDAGTTAKFSLGGKPSAPAVTIVSVNGVRQALSPGSAFPASDPVFVLVAEKPGARAVIVGVKGGAYASGAQTAKLTVGKPLTLVNTSTGARYRIVLVAVGSGPAESAQAGGGKPSSP